MMVSRGTRIGIALVAMLWPALGISVVPLVSAALAALVAYDGITSRIALTGLAITLAGALLAGLSLTSQALPWLVALLLLIMGESFFALASRGIARAFIIGFVVFCILETLTIIGAGIDGGFLIARLSAGLTESRIGWGAVILLAFLALLHVTDRQSR